VAEPNRIARDQTPASTHPKWCDPRLCTNDTQRGELLHLSEAQTLATDSDEIWSFRLHRTDEPQLAAIGTVMLVIDVTDLCDESEPVTSHWLEMDGVDALIARLTIERNRARFLDR
jgi:hypothetical protein